MSIKFYYCNIWEFERNRHFMAMLNRHHVVLSNFGASISRLKYVHGIDSVELPDMEELQLAAMDDDWCF